MTVSKCLNLIMNSTAWMNKARQSSIMLKHSSTAQAPCSQCQHHDRAGHIDPPGVAVWQGSISLSGQQDWSNARGDHPENLSPRHAPRTQKLSCLCNLKLMSSYTIPCGLPHALQRQQAVMPQTGNSLAVSCNCRQLSGLSSDHSCSASCIQQLSKWSQFTWQTRSSQINLDQLWVLRKSNKKLTGDLEDMCCFFSDQNVLEATEKWWHSSSIVSERR